MTVSGFASPTGPPLVGEDGKREWVYAAEGAKAETQGPWPDIENTSRSFGRTNVSRYFIQDHRGKEARGGGCEIGTDTGNG